MMIIYANGGGAHARTLVGPTHIHRNIMQCRMPCRVVVVDASERTNGLSYTSCNGHNIESAEAHTHNPIIREALSNQTYRHTQGTYIG